jgi:hypothetical protein
MVRHMPHSLNEEVIFDKFKEVRHILYTSLTTRNNFIKWIVNRVLLNFNLINEEAQ